MSETSSSQQNAEGSYIAQAQGKGAQASVVVEAPKPRIPLHCPARAEHFTDRETELAQLLADLQPSRVVTLCGPGGIGKSALAAEAVWQLAPGNDPPDRFPDGIIFHNFYNQPEANLALEHIARSFGEELGQGSRRDAARRALAGRQALIVLDGAENADDLQTVLDVCGSCGVLVTSRRTENAGATWHDIAPLPLAETVQLLQAWGRERAANQEAARQICDLVGGLPLAVQLVGRYLAQRQQQAETYLAWLQTSPLHALNQGQRQVQSVLLLLERSLAQVSAEANQVLSVIGELALAPFESGVVAEALEIPPFQAENLLGELVSYGFLLRPQERYQVSHALIHTYARRRMVPSDEVMRRLAAYYTTLSEEQSTLGKEGYRRLDSERVHIMAVLAKCVEKAHWEATRRLIKAIDNYLEIQGHSAERKIACEYGLKAARILKDRKDEGLFLDNLGSVCLSLGQMEEAQEYYDQALELARDIGDSRLEATVMNKQGFAYRFLGQMGKAIECHEKALEVAQRTGDRHNECYSRSGLGSDCIFLGQMEEAIKHLNSALEISQEIGDRLNEGVIWGNLGLAYRDMGRSREEWERVEEAVKHYEQALKIAREVGSRINEGGQLVNIGLAYEDLWNADDNPERVEEAIKHYEQALKIAREIGNRHIEGLSLGNLGEANRKLGKLEKAIKYHEKALKISRDTQNRRDEGLDLGNLGLVYRDLGMVDKAREKIEEALEIFEKIDHPLEADESRRLLAQL